MTFLCKFGITSLFLKLLWKQVRNLKKVRYYTTAITCHLSKRTVLSGPVELTPPADRQVPITNGLYYTGQTSASCSSFLGAISNRKWLFEKLLSFWAFIWDHVFLYNYLSGRQKFIFSQIFITISLLVIGFVIILSYFFAYVFYSNLPLEKDLSHQEKSPYPYLGGHLLLVLQR